MLDLQEILGIYWNPVNFSSISLNDNHLYWNSDTSYSSIEGMVNSNWSLRTEQTTWSSLLYKMILVTDIDQTDLHRFEPSSRIFQKDEHSHQ